MASVPDNYASDSLLSPADILACLRGKTPTGTMSSDFSFSRAVENKNEYESQDMKKLEPKRLQLPKSASEVKLFQGLSTDSPFPTEPPKTIFKDVRKGILIRRRERSSLTGAEAHQRHISMQLFHEARAEFALSRGLDPKNQSTVKVAQERLLTEAEGSSEPKKGKKVTFLIKQDIAEVVPKFDLLKLENARRSSCRTGSGEGEGRLASRTRGERLSLEAFRPPMMGNILRESTPMNSCVESSMKAKTPDMKSISSNTEQKTSTMAFAEKIVNKLNLMKNNPESPQNESVVRKTFFPKVPTSYTPLNKRLSSEIIFPTSPDKVVKGLAFKKDDIILRQETPTKTRANIPASPSSIEIIGERKTIKQYSFNVDPHKKKDESGNTETEGKIRRCFRQTSMIIRNLKDESIQRAIDSKEDLKRKLMSPMKAQHNIDILVPSINIL